MKKILLCIAAAIAAFASAGVLQAGSKSIELPQDLVQWRPSSHPGYAKITANCVACHSADYAQYQPPTAPRAYWENMVKRMKAVFKAPIDDADIPIMVDYLVKTYGNEQPAK
jgi:sulfite dehydrogenase (cytochrome) subunit B